MKNSLYKICCVLILASYIIITGCSTTKKDLYEGMAADQMYEQGKIAVQKQRYANAIKDFEALEARYPYGNTTCKAQLALIHAYYKNEENASALAASDRFIRMYPTHPHIDYVYYLKGLINYDDNFSTAYRYFPIDRSLRDPTTARQAFDDFKTLLQRYPSSCYAADAKQRMINLRNNLANYELDVANYYLSRKAYIAAANRAAFIVSQFNETTAVPSALELMIKAYEALGMAKLAEDARSILANNFNNKAML